MLTRPVQDPFPAVSALATLDADRAGPNGTESWLSTSEREELARLQHLGRRREWAGARLALKTLLREDGLIVAPEHCSIHKDPRGKPIARIRQPDGTQRQVECSLAHKMPYALVAYSRADGQRGRIGVDIERVRPRLVELRKAFSGPDDHLLDQTPEDVYCTVLWTFKEAASKVLGQGLGSCFEAIVCRETAPGACRITTPEGVVMTGRYRLVGRFALAVVSLMA